MARKLSDAAQAIFDEQYAILEQCGMLPDMELLSAYANALAQMQTAQTEIDASGEVLTVGGKTKTNPYVSIRDRALEQVERLSERLSIDRTQLLAPTPPKRRQGWQGRHPRATVKQAHDALVKSAGVVTHAARLLGISHRTLRTMLERSPQLRAARLEIEIGNKDLAETKLHEAIRKGDAWAICFYLKTHADEYIVRRPPVELMGKGGGPIQVEQGIDLSGLSDEEFAQLQQLMAKASGAAVAVAAVVAADEAD